MLNGIAYDAARDRLFVTGKLWPRLFEIRLRTADEGRAGAGVTRRAHAKINLDLRVLGTRPDGFHELRTVFQAIALHDTIECMPRDGPFAIECDDRRRAARRDRIWCGGRREALWRSLRRAGPGARRASSGCEKRIPLQAGLGGGSADAAATLLALARLWRVPVRPKQLDRRRRRRSAPTCRSSWPAERRSGSARGDEIYPLADLPRHWVVLLVPGFGVSTRDAYGWYDAEREHGAAPACRGAAVRARAVAVAGGADDQRPRGADRPSSSRDRPDEDGAAAGRRAGGGDVRQRLDGVRPVSEATRRAGGRRAAVGSGWRVLLTESLGRGEYARRSRPVPKPAR